MQLEGPGLVNRTMKVFVTGVNGYIGAVLAPYLMQRGLEVLGLDTGYYRDGWLYSDNRHLAHTPETLNKDLRDVTERDLAGCDAVAHLAELSNDPLGQNNPEVTHQINHKGSVALAEAARARRHPALRVHLVVQRVRRRDRRVSGRDIRRPTRKPHMRSARSSSSATSAGWPGRTSARCFCEMRRHMVHRRECASTSC